VVAGIYGPNHWSHATELTDSNFDSFIDENVANGKTVMVRFIASEGWGWWRKQAPSWNRAIEQFSSNNDIVFGDVNLSKSRPTSKNVGSPGAGGWPTLRTYDAENPGGKQYEQKTSKAVCDEMKEESYMDTYIMEAAVISQCDVASGATCSEKETEYIAKYKAKGADDINSQSDRLAEMSKKKGAKQSITGYKWLAQRRAILKQLSGNVGEL